VIDVLETTREILHRAGLEPRTLSVIELNRSDSTQSSIVLLVFADGRAEPSFVVKAVTGGEQARALACEFENLTHLHERGAAAFRQTVPRPVHLGRIDGYDVLAETAMRGVRMKNFPPNSYFGSRRFREHFTSIVAWLHEFHQCLAAEPSPAADGSGPEGAGAAIERYRGCFQCSTELDELLTETEQRLLGRRYPQSPWHGDFCSANILITDDQRIGVIDWEHRLVSSWPLLDLLYFVCSIWCVPYRKGSAPLAANYRRLFFEQHRLTELIRDSVRQYAGKLDVAVDDLLPLSVICWVVYANRKHETLSAEAAGPLWPGQTHWPLVMFEGDRCLNLELLAGHRHDYVLSS
jgi:aminoglycoside phosphotransferase (APT) family kinase protein